MSTFEVTLTQKVKIMVEAETPADAVEQAVKKINGKPFEPTSWGVKDKTEE
jgi:hypothetical protein